MSNITDTFLLFSVCQTTVSEEDNMNATFMIDIEYDFIPCFGVYQGEAEQSFIAPMSEFCTVDNLCRRFKQECFLMCIDGIGWLVYPGKDKQLIGKLNISKTQPSGDYTELIDGTFIWFE